MKPPLIVGLGNEGFQDEAVGLFLLQQVCQYFPGANLARAALISSLLEFIPIYNGEEAVLFISGAYMHQQPGEYCTLPLPHVHACDSIIGIDPGDILTLYHEIPMLKQAQANVLAIQIRWNEWGDELSPEVSQTAKRLLKNFWKILEDLSFPV